MDSATQSSESRYAAHVDTSRSARRLLMSYDAESVYAMKPSGSKHNVMLVQPILRTVQVQVFGLKWIGF